MDERVYKWVAMLRGINLGGANRVPMAQLRDIATGLGWRNVRSYIASGNLVFEAEAPRPEQLQAGILEAFGIEVPVLVLPAQAIVQAADDCAWDVAGNLVHAIFCWHTPRIDQALLDALKAPDEELVVDGSLVWLYAPSGVARSRLMGRIDRVLGVQGTARNLNTLRKLAEMVR